ncbi:MAG TPA: glycosyltransferase family 39 protein [Candidatus Eisenbacteria bacterium]|nr:glycosyltransferase family 39 protein [Candidatus Eisenbacteria bacterium]
MTAATAAAPAAPRPARRFPWLPAILLVALAFRVREALREPLLFDELYAVDVARRGPAGIHAILMRDVDQPVHFFLMWVWMHLGLGSPLALKALSIGFGLAGVAAVAAIGARLYGRRAGLLAAALLAVERTHVYYSQVVRFHTLGWLLALLVLLLGWAWTSRPGWARGLALAAVTALALGTDTFAWMVCLPVWAWGAWRARGDARRLAAWLGIVALAALAVSPHLPTLAGQLRRDYLGDLAGPGMPAGALLDALRYYAFGALYLVPVLLAVALLPLADRARREASALLWAEVVITTLVPWTLSREHVHLFFPRQFLYAMAPLALLAGAGLDGLRPGPLRIGAAAALLAFGLRGAVEAHVPPEAVELPAARAWLAAHARPGDLVLCTELHGYFYLRDRRLPGATTRFLIAPDDHSFHYSDGILVVGSADTITPQAWRAAAAAGRRWWGVQALHDGHVGTYSAALLDSAGRVVWRQGRVAVWGPRAGP